MSRLQVRTLLALATVTIVVAGCRKKVTDADVVSAVGRTVDSLPAPAEPRWPMVQAAYREREYRPVWTSLEGPTPRGAELVAALSNAEAQGLRSSDFDLPVLRSLLARAYDPKLPRDSVPAAIARLEFFLTSGFLRYGTQIFSGRTQPSDVDRGWFIKDRRTGVDSLLYRALRQDTFDAMVAPLYPRDPAYQKLVQALVTYRALEAGGGWDSIPVPPRLKLEPGAVDSIVPLVRRRLLVTGELAEASTADPMRYDSVLAGAVARFQDHHGLETDSVIGRSTVLAMNVPVAMRIGQIILNMERYRWLPDNLGARHILVNIPDYNLHAYEDGKEVIQMRVVVGKDFDNPTPVFADSMSYLVFRPYWNVPARILKEEIIPAARRDPEYMAKNNYEILRGREVVDPGSIEWARLDTARLNFYVRQKPGPANSLGLVKFMFPNQYDVYLHDTPARSLFRRAGRAASHGCIRVERPDQLAEFALSRNTEWDLKKIRQAMQRDSTRQVGLRQKIPVYIVYFTAFVRDGAVRFRSDLYGTDERAIALLMSGGDQAAAGGGMAAGMGR